MEDKEKEKSTCLPDNFTSPFATDANKTNEIDFSQLELVKHR
jgi:hypothetical protein